MTTRFWPGALLLTVVVGATTAEAQSVQVGTLRGEVPPDAAVGALRGPIAPGAGVGPFSTSFPASPDSGGLVGFRGPTGAPPAPARGPDTGVGMLQGSVPLAPRTGALAEPAPPGTFFGPPTPADIARRNEALAEVHQQDLSLVNVDAALERATTLRQETFGPTHPAVADGLEDQARLMERYNRLDKAAELQDRAAKIREEAARRPR
jgi:hypothetical protein